MHSQIQAHLVPGAVPMSTLKTLSLGPVMPYLPPPSVQLKAQELTKVVPLVQDNATSKNKSLNLKHLIGNIKAHNSLSKPT